MHPIEERAGHEKFIEAHIKEGSDIPLETMMFYVRDPIMLEDVLNMNLATARLIVELQHGIDARDRRDGLVEVAIAGLKHFRTSQVSANMLRSRVIGSNPNRYRGNKAQGKSTRHRG
ncbi:hypothetical protein KY385_02630 [Candidatus Parcubacteria bacterium]|nr:hypothetical protein [Candidatus Parcubacteria bacterium]